MRILALDVGEKRIGVALSDPTGLLASPLTTIESKGQDFDIDEVLRLAEEHEAGEIVIGLPLSMSGRRGPQAGRVDAFVKAMAERTDIPLKSMDERLSSVQAERMLRESGVEPSKNKARVDSAAAAIVLQSYLDSRRIT